MYLTVLDEHTYIQTKSKDRSLPNNLSNNTEDYFIFVSWQMCSEGELLKGLRKGKDVQMRVSENAQSKQSQGLQNFSMLEKHR